MHRDIVLPLCSVLLVQRLLVCVNYRYMYHGKLARNLVQMRWWLLYMYTLLSIVNAAHDATRGRMAVVESNTNGEERKSPPPRQRLAEEGDEDEDVFRPSIADEHKDKGEDEGEDEMEEDEEVEEKEEERLRREKGKKQNAPPPMPLPPKLPPPRPPPPPPTRPEQVRITFTHAISEHPLAMPARDGSVEQQGSEYEPLPAQEVFESRRTAMIMLLVGVLIFTAAGLCLTLGLNDQAPRSHSTKATRKSRKKAIEAAVVDLIEDDHDVEIGSRQPLRRAQPQGKQRDKLRPEGQAPKRAADDDDEGELAIDREDIEAVESFGNFTVKVHVELPSISGGEIVSFRVTKRRLGSSFDELYGVLLQGVPPGTLSLEQIGAMQMHYENHDGEMLEVTRDSTEMSELVSEAQAIFVSRRAKAASTRAAGGPRQIGHTGYAGDATPLDMTRAAAVLGAR
jgi:hypothetical protein